MSQGKAQYIYFLHAVDASKAASREGWTDEDRETFDLHWANLERLRDERKLILAGRSPEPDGRGPAIVIIEAESDEDARRIFAAEPFVTRGFATATLHPFNIAISRNEV